MKITFSGMENIISLVIFLNLLLVIKVIGEDFKSPLKSLSEVVAFCKDAEKKNIKLMPSEYREIHYHSNCNEVLKEDSFFQEMEQAFKSFPRENFFRKGKECLPVPLLTNSHVVDMGDLAVLSPTNRISRCDGDEAQLFVMEHVIKFKDYCDSHSNALIIDIGALHGDMGLYTAKKGCRTVMFEPLPVYAAHIARSIQINGLEKLATIRNEAVSFLSSLRPMAGTGNSIAAMVADSADERSLRSVPGAVLDQLFLNETDIYFMKVDVEGFEGVVLSTAMGLFRAKKIQHAIFEFSPMDPYLIRNGTNFDTFLPTLFNLGATKCYSLHRRRPTIFEIKPEDAALYRKTMNERSIQSDVYCSFVPVNFDASVWSPQIDLMAGHVLNPYMHGGISRETARDRAQRDSRFKRAVGEAIHGHTNNHASKN